MRVLDYGEVKLIDSMPSHQWDRAVLDAARISYSANKKKEHTAEGSEALIRYLMRHHHDTPFEMVQTKWYVKCPIFIARQWMRHRTFSYNEVSGRYSALPDEWYTPNPWRAQSSTNKQGSGEPMDYYPEPVEQEAFQCYTHRLNSGVAKELARTCLPLSTYTEFVCSTNLRNLLHFLELRMHPHAQEEFRVYADAMARTVRGLAPLTWQAFEDYRLNAVTLTACEQQALVDPNYRFPTQREENEWKTKRESLRFSGTHSDPS